MKIKVAELISRKKAAERVRAEIENLKPADVTKFSAQPLIDDDDAEEAAAMMAEYEQLLDMLVNAAEITI